MRCCRRSRRPTATPRDGLRFQCSTLNPARQEAASVSHVAGHGLLAPKSVGTGNSDGVFSVIPGTSPPHVAGHSAVSGVFPLLVRFRSRAASPRAPAGTHHRPPWPCPMVGEPDCYLPVLRTDGPRLFHSRAAAAAVSGPRCRKRTGCRSCGMFPWAQKTATDSDCRHLVAYAAQRSDVGCGYKSKPLS